MRRWRVGTFSMGVLLILVGALLMMGEFQQISKIKLLYTWWPVILIILGLEVLAHVYLSKEEHPVAKYDGFSIFIILLIIIVTSAVYGVKFFIDNLEVLQNLNL
jgi:membrane-bound ClpP family serine protease